MKYQFEGEEVRNYASASRLEWVLTNGAGAFAMGTVAGSNTRRYHGHLVASDANLERIVLLANIEAALVVNGETIELSTNQYLGTVFPEGHKLLESFEAGDEVVWRWKARHRALTKRLWLVHGQNVCEVTYTNEGAHPIELVLKPLVCKKPYHGNFSEDPNYGKQVECLPGETRVNGALILHHEGADCVPVQGWYYRFEYLRETERGLPSRDDLFCPCELTYRLAPGESCVLRAESTLGANGISEPADADSFLSSEAKLFALNLNGRRSILAGLPWFTDWGRDTMISLPGIYLCSGQVEEARQCLSSYRVALNRGLIPNRFTENGGAEYNTVDATLWFMNAAHATLEAEWNDAFAADMFAAGEEIIRFHVAGTHYGIGVAEDGLLKQGTPGVQLTWMDAKIGEWVVTPRHGKPVEINGLWINALRIMEAWADRLGLDGLTYKIRAEQAEASFEQKFWSEMLGFYLDTVDPDDGSLRPNQVIAMSLPFGPAQGERAKKALEHVTVDLLTPYGLRTLGPREPAYRGRFKGALPELDAAYHQGTVWPWLLGPYCDAVMRITGDLPAVQKALSLADAMLVEAGIGGISEVYDGDAPHTPGGCPWQAWSLAEIRRVTLRYLHPTH